MPPPVELALALVPAAGVCARLAAAVAVGAVPLRSAVPARALVAVTLALSAVALPRAALAPTSVGWPLVVVGEAAVGAGLGLAAAAAFAAAAWAGGIVGSVTGLSWADDFGSEGDPQSAGMARLAWWLGLAGFFAAGGHLAVVVGLVDSFRMIPVGTPPAAVAARVCAAPDAALGLALALAGPALAAVMTFHLATAVCLRTVRFAPGAGLVQTAAALVALGIVLTGAPTWLGGFGGLSRDLVERALPVVAAARP